MQNFLTTNKALFYQVPLVQQWWHPTRSSETLGTTSPWRTTQSPCPSRTTCPPSPKVTPLQCSSKTAQVSRTFILTPMSPSLIWGTASASLPIRRMSASLLSSGSLWLPTPQSGIRLIHRWRTRTRAMGRWPPWRRDPRALMRNPFIWRTRRENSTKPI
jgi:hypothetical protein